MSYDDPYGLGAYSPISLAKVLKKIKEVEKEAKEHHKKFTKQLPAKAGRFFGD